MMIKTVAHSDKKCVISKVDIFSMNFEARANIISNYTNVYLNRNIQTLIWEVK